VPAQTLTFLLRNASTEVWCVPFALLKWDGKRSLRQIADRVSTTSKFLPMQHPLFMNLAAAAFVYSDL